MLWTILEVEALLPPLVPTCSVSLFKIWMLLIELRKRICVGKSAEGQTGHDS